MNGVNKKCLQAVEDSKNTILSLGKYLHQNPEPPLKEFLAAERISQILLDNGFTLLEKFDELPTAVIGHKKIGSGPRIAFMAEYDALPGIGHACGHNLIAAMSIGAALSSARILEQFNFQGEIWLIGAPGEEILVGKKILLNKGIFNQVDLAMMIHPANQTIVSPIMLATTGLDFVFHGQAAHAASFPEKGKNALDAVILLFNNINALRQQIKDDARIHGIVLEGGEAYNIIPSRARARIGVRALEKEYFHDLLNRVKNCGHAAALATDTRLDITPCSPTCYGLKSNPTLAEIFKRQLDYLGIPIFDEYSAGASTDFGNVSQVLPVIHPYLKVTKGDKRVEHHTPAYTMLSGSTEVYDATLAGAQLLALTACEILKNPELMDQIKASSM